MGAIMDKYFIIALMLVMIILGMAIGRMMFEGKQDLRGAMAYGLYEKD